MAGRNSNLPSPTRRVKRKGAANAALATNGEKARSSVTSSSDRRSDGGTETGSDTSSVAAFFAGGGGSGSNKTSSVGTAPGTDELLLDDQGGGPLTPTSPTKRKKRKPKYTYDGRVNNNVRSSSQPPPGIHEEADPLLIDFPEKRSPTRRRRMSPTKYGKPKNKGVTRGREDDDGEEQKDGLLFYDDLLPPHSPKKINGDTRATLTSRPENRPRKGRARSRPPTRADDDEQPQSPKKKTPRSPAKSPTKRRVAPGSPTKVPRSATKKMSSEDDDADSRVAPQTSHGRSRSVSPTKRSSANDQRKTAHYFSKYGTWKELQRVQQSYLKKKPDEPDTLDDDLLSALASVESVSEGDRPHKLSALSARVRGDRFLHSLCVNERAPEYLRCAVHVLIGFDANVHLGSRTQLMTWYTLDRLRRFWIASGDPAPEGEDVLQHNDTVDFLGAIAKLCYHISNTEQVVVTGIVENDRRNKKVWIHFKQVRNGG